MKKMKRSKLIAALTLTAGMLFNSGIKAQSQTHEVGMRFSSLENFDFIYKKELEENKLRRYSLGFTNLNFIDRENNEAFNFGLGFAIGTEKRKQIAEKLKFIHGFEPFAELNFTSSEISDDDRRNSGQVIAGLGYVLGFQYDFSDKFYVNLETVPSLYGAVNFAETSEDEISEDGYEIGAGFNSNAIAVSLVYRFTKDKKN